MKRFYNKQIKILMDYDKATGNFSAVDCTLLEDTGLGLVVSVTADGVVRFYPWARVYQVEVL